MEEDSLSKEEVAYWNNYYKRRKIGIVFRVVFYIYGLYAMFLTCAYSFYMGAYGIMALKIIFFPYSMIISPLVGIFSGAYGWTWIFIWLGGMGSYAISTFYGKLRPIG